MEYTIDELKQKIFSNVFDVYDIFKNHFGEQYVDLQNVPDNDKIVRDLGYYPDIKKNNDKYEISDSQLADLIHFYSNHFIIYVWWPKVTVTNEHNKSIVIWDLYAQIKINIDGCIPFEYYGFLLNRSRYDVAQFQSNYLHSHIREIPKNDFTKFGEPCLGTASIKNTIVTLKSNNDPVIWMMFCEELSKAVTVESLTGHPWKYLEQVGKYQKLYGYDGYNVITGSLEQHLRTEGDNYRHTNLPYWLNNNDLIALLKQFTQYYLKHGHLQFCYNYGRFDIGLSYYDYMIDISNSFIDFYNEVLKGDKAKTAFMFKTQFLLQVLVVNRTFNKLGSDNPAPIDNYIGQHVLTFKGRDIKLRIDDSEEQKTTTSIILNHNVAMYIRTQILKIINYRFNGRSKDTDSGTKETTAKAHKTVCYL